MMKISRFYLLLLAMAVFTSCRQEMVREIPYRAVAERPLPSQASTYHIKLDAASVVHTIQLNDIEHRPWKISCGAVGADAPKISAHQLKIKGTWYKLFWRGPHLYLKLKQNDQSSPRQVFVVFTKNNGNGCIGCLIRQAGK